MMGYTALEPIRGIHSDRASNRTVGGRQTRALDIRDGPVCRTSDR